MPYHSQQTAILQTIQDWSPPGGERLAYLLSTLGGEYFYLFLIPLLLWFAPWRSAVPAARVMIWTDLAGEWIKWTVKWPRPSDSVALAQETSPGFVSTHAAISLGVAVVLAWDRPRLRPWLALWVLGVGWSRVRLGVHFPLDVVGGWALGWLVAMLALHLGEDSRRAAYLSVSLGLLFALLWPAGGGTESLQRDLGMLFGLEVGLLQRLRGEQDSGPPKELSKLWGLLRLLAMLIAYVGLKAIDWPRLPRYLILALLASWRKADGAEKEIS